MTQRELIVEDLNNMNNNKSQHEIPFENNLKREPSTDLNKSHKS